MRPLSPFKRRQKGFTLIELIIVIVIVGILAAVAIPKLSSMTEDAKRAKNEAILGALKSAWTIAFSKVPSGPPTDAQIAAQMADPTCTAAAGTITCTGATTTYTYPATPAATTGPSDIVCTNTNCASSP